jgi:hypothetical protein
MWWKFSRFIKKIAIGIMKATDARSQDNGGYERRNAT